MYPHEREFQSRTRRGVAGAKRPGPDGVPDGRWQLHELRDVPLLAVLGERGIGKTSILETELAALDEEQAKVKIVTVTDHHSVEDLVAALKALVEWARTIASDVEPPSIVHVLIDGLDDAALVTAGVARAVNAQAIRPLKLLENESLAVRIVLACRTPLWPLFAARLADEDTAIHVVAVAPLGLEDIATAAEANTLDGGGFVDSLEARGLLPLAEHPATLIALLGAETASSPAPTTLIGAYEAALRTLCQPDREDLDANAAPVDIVVDTASLIAGYARLSGYGAISLDQSTASAATFGALPVGELVARTFKDAGHGDVAWSTVLQVAQSGIYRGQGADTYQPSHQSYIDFLTARFLNRLSKLEAPRMLDLVLGPRIEGRRRVWPELAEVAGHLASYNPDVQAGLLREDPWALLRSDLHSADIDERRELVDALLRSASPLDDLSTGAPLLARVDHPGLAAQLVPVLRQASATTQVEAAFEIAVACRPPALTDTLVELAFDSSVDRRLRVKAIVALPRPIALGAATRLLDFARTARRTPADEELAYWIVDAVWPESIPAEDVIPLLPESSLSEAAERVLAHTLPVATPNDLLPGLLGWAFDAVASSRFKVRRCAVMLLARAAAQDAFDPRLPGYLADVVIQGRLIFPEEWQVIGDVLRGAIPLLRAVVDMVTGRVTSNERVTPTWTGLLAWLLTEAKVADESARGLFASAIMAVADLGEPRTLQAVRNASAHVPELIGRLPPADDEPAAQPDAAAADGPAELARQLGAVLADTPGGEAWPQLLSVLLGENALTTPMSSGWRAHALLHEAVGDHELIGQVRRSALAFIAGAAPTSLTITSTTRAEAMSPTWQMSENAALGLRAFELLAAAEDPHILLGKLTSECWRSWTQVLLFLAPRDTQQRAAYGAAVAYAYEADPDTFPGAVIEQVTIQFGVHTDAEALEVLDACWDKGRLERDLSLRATALLDHAGVTETVLRRLMRRNPGQDAYRAALNALDARDSDHQPTQAALGATLALLAVPWQQESPYSPVWYALADSPELLRRVLATTPANSRQDWSSSLHNAPPEMLPGLYTTARQLYAPEQDPADAGHRRSERALAAEARDSILREIASQADPGALAFLLEASSVESRPKVFDRLLKIAYTAAISAWTPTRVEHLAALVANPARRLVNDSAALLDVILESLAEFEADLQGDVALAHLLWNQTDQSCHPKPEPSLSDLTAWFLDLKLAGHQVVINREVQVRRVKAKGMPDSVDIKAEIHGAGDTGEPAPKVMIEVKGAWNDKLMDSIETQLHARYLKQPGSVGLYLVGYYSCPAWEACERDKSRRAQHGGIEELRRSLADRASRLTPAPATAVLDVRLHDPKPH